MHFLISPAPVAEEASSRDKIVVGFSQLGAESDWRSANTESMESFLRKYSNINVVYCENDNEAFGAIEAIEAAGKKVGSDITEGEIMVISFDGVKKDAMEYVHKGKITCIAECNPLHGPRVQAIIEQLEAGETPEKFSYVDEVLKEVARILREEQKGKNMAARLGGEEFLLVFPECNGDDAYLNGSHSEENQGNQSGKKRNRGHLKGGG